MMKARSSFVLILLFSLCPCAGMEQAMVEHNCNRDAAYEKGMNDGRLGAEMNSRYAAICPSESRDAVTAGYREGYNYGLGSIQQSNTAPTVINVNIGGASNGAELNPKAWYCTTRAFTDEYEAFGPTELEAGQRVVAKCAAKNNEMFCKTTSCKRNQ